MLPTEPEVYTGKKLGDLRQINLDGLIAHIRVIAGRFPKVAGLYLFGSALEMVRPKSDIDAGLILPEKLYGKDPSWGMDAADKEAAALARALGSWGPHKFGVTVLREENTGFVMRVLRDARPAYLADLERVSGFLERVAHLNDDVDPFRRTYLAARRQG